MSTEFIGDKAWARLRRANRKSRRPAAVAIAYFGEGGAQRLPLKKGSRLVIDASEAAVKNGQTCPEDLLELQKKGVRIFSIPNLHAKVYVFGSQAFVGSANVSSHSENALLEAMVRITDRTAVSSACEFVKGLCSHELGPEKLKRLAKLYRRPQWIQGNGINGHRSGRGPEPKLPRLLLAQLKRESWSDRDQATHDAALKVAKRRQVHPRTFELDSFRHTGKCPYLRDDVLVQVTDEGGGRILVDPPGNVLHIESRQYGSRWVSFVYLEHPSRRRRYVKALARQLGYGTGKRLRKQGIVHDQQFAHALLNVWVR